MKVKELIKKHKIFLLLVAFIYLYEFVVVSKCSAFIVDDILYAYHAVDFSMGFCTKILPGAIYNKLVGIYSYKAVSIYVNVIYFIFICLVAYLFEKFIKSVPEKYSFETFLIAVLFFTGPFFSAFLCEFGMLDFYWALFTVIAIYFLRNKYLKWLLPVLIFSIILVHYSSVVCYVAALLLLLLYLAACEEDKGKKRSYLSIFAVSAVTAVSEILYFLRYEYDNLTYSVSEFNDILVNERNVKYLDYYDFALYRHVIDENNFPVTSLDNVDVSSLSGFLKNILYQIEVTLKMSHLKYFWFVYIIAAVLLVFLLYILISYIKKTDKTAKKFVVALMILQFFAVAFIGLCLSTDIIRWLAHGFIILFSFSVFIIATDYKEFFEKFKMLLDKIYWPFIGYCLTYAFTITLIYG